MTTLIEMEGNERNSIGIHEQQQALTQESLRKLLANPFFHYEESSYTEFSRLVNLLDSHHVRQLILHDPFGPPTLISISNINRKFGLPISFLDTLISILLDVPFKDVQQQQQQPVSSNDPSFIRNPNGESQTDSKLLLQIAQILKYSVSKNVNSISPPQFVKLLKSCTIQSLKDGNEFTKLIFNEVAVAILAYVDTPELTHQAQRGTSILKNEELMSCLQQRICYASTKARSKFAKFSLTTEGVVEKERNFLDSTEKGNKARYSQSETSNVAIGTEILKKVSISNKTCHDDGFSKPNKFQAHAVKTQEAVASTSNEFKSERSTIEQIYLANTLNRASLQNANSLRGQEKNLKSLTSKADISTSWSFWLESDRYNIAEFLKMAKNNREKNDRDKVILSDIDIEWLRSRFLIDAMQYSLVDWSLNTTYVIAEIFSLISKDQKIPTEPQDVVLHLAKEIFTINYQEFVKMWLQKGYSELYKCLDGFYPWENCRMNILTTINNHTIRNNENLTPPLLKILEEFILKPECTQKMKSMILFIKSRSTSVRQEISQLCSTFLRMCEMIRKCPTDSERECAISFVAQHIISKTQFRLIFDKCTESEKNFYKCFLHLILEFKLQFDIRVKVAAILEMYLGHSFVEALDWSYVFKLSDILLIVSPQVQLESSSSEENDSYADEDNPKEENKLKNENWPKPSTSIRLLSWMCTTALEYDEKSKNLLKRSSGPEAGTSRTYNTADTQSQIVQFKSSLVRSILHCLGKKTIESLASSKHYSTILNNLIICSLESGTDSTDNPHAPLHITRDLQVLIVAALGSWLDRHPGVYLEKSQSLAPKLLEKHLVSPDGLVVLKGNPEATIFETEPNFKIPSEIESESYFHDHRRDTTGTYVSAIVGRILIEQVKHANSVSVFYQVLPYALESLKTHPDKTTRILCAEYIFESFVHSKTTGHVLCLNQEALGLLRNLSQDDQVIDVQIYCSSSYCLGLSNIVCRRADADADVDAETKFVNITLESYEVDALAYMYVWENLVLEGREFKFVINPTILNILQKLAQSSNTQVQFSEDIFSMLHLVLRSESSSNNSNSSKIILQVLNIFKEYINLHTVPGSSDQFRKPYVPNSCIEAIENIYFIDDPEVLCSCERIFNNLLIRGHSLSDVCLHQVLNNLVNIDAQSTNDNDFIRYSYLCQIIFLANQNQDVSDAVFERLDMELAGCTVMAYFELMDFRLLFREHCDRLNMQYHTEPSFECVKVALNVILTLTKNCLKLSMLSHKALITSLSSCARSLELISFKILAAINENGHQISREIVTTALDVIQKKTDVTLEEARTIGTLCLSLLTRNQQIPNSFIDFMCIQFTTTVTENAEENQICWLLILVELAENHYVLRSDVVRKICGCVYELKWNPLRSEILHALVKLIAHGSIYSRCYAEFKAAFMSIVTNPADAGNVIQSSLRDIENAICGLKLLYDLDLSCVDWAEWKLVQEKCMNLELGVKAKTILEGSDLISSRLSIRLSNQLKGCEIDMDFILMLADTVLTNCWIYEQAFVIDRLERILVSSDASDGLIIKVLNLLESFPKIPTKVFHAVFCTLVNNKNLYITNPAALLMENAIIGKKIDLISDTLINVLLKIQRDDCQNILQIIYENGLAPTSFKPSDQLKLEWKLKSMRLSCDKVEAISNFLLDPNLLDQEPGNLGKYSEMVKDLLVCKAPALTLKSIPHVDILMSYLLLQQPRREKSTWSNMVNSVIGLKSLIGASSASEDVGMMLEIIEDALIQSQTLLCNHIGNALRCSLNCTHGISHRILYEAYGYALENFPMYFERPSDRMCDVFRTMIKVLECFQTNENTSKFCTPTIKAAAHILWLLTHILKFPKIQLHVLVPIKDYDLIEILQKLLQHSSVRIRNLAFGNLKILETENRYSFKLMIESFNKAIPHSSGDSAFEISETRNGKDFIVDILESLFSTSYWDLLSFKNLEKNEWVRHLLITDCVSVYKSCDTETKSSLHVKLIALFTKFTPKEGLQLLQLILYSPCLALEFIPVLDTIRILEFVCQLGFQESIKILKGSHTYFSNCVDFNPLTQWRDVFHKSVLKNALKSKFCTDIKVSDEIISALTDQLVQISGFQNATRILNMLKESTFKTVSSFHDNLISMLTLFPRQQSISKIVSKNSSGCNLGKIARSCTEFANFFKVEYLMTLWPRQYEGENVVKQYFIKIIAQGLPFDAIIMLLKSLLSSPSGDASAASTESWKTAENILGQICTYQVSASVFNQILITCKSSAIHTQLSSPLLVSPSAGSDSASSRAATTQENLISTVSKIIMEHTFQGSTGKKDLKEFLKDFDFYNSNMCLESLESDFRSKIELILKGQKESNILNIETHICEWTKHDILEWLREHKLRPNLLGPQEFYVEYLTVAKRAISLVRNYDLTYVQIISCLLALKPNLPNSQAKGQLQQIVTGCGKSTIVAIMAVFGALQGKKVDVYTSSPVLAERDAREWSHFYQLFSLTSDHNGDRNQVYLIGPKKCYERDIVYGDTSQFQFDTLRHEYSGLRTRGGRDFQLALIDEVDCMLIDDSSKLARLSTTLPAMDCLQVMYHFIWERTRYLHEHLYSFSNNFYYVEGHVSNLENLKVLYRFADVNQNDQIFEIRDFQRFLTAGNNFEKARIHRIDSVDAFILDHLVSYSQSLITSPEPLVKIPKNLFDFVQGQIPQWVKSALSALVFQENVNYIVDEGQIKPVDYQTTGVIQSCTNWSNGLHQFLQIKHSLKIKSETVTTNFLSNIAMFERYGPNTVGLTGTLGSEVSRKVLADAYSVTVYLIPENHFRSFHRLQDLVLGNKKEWRNKIVHSASHESAKGRGVLIIVETISEAQIISELLINFGILAKLYTKNNANQEKHVERIHPHDVIVATNLAGRGTDIQASEINSSGGLHVILTFLPDSLRVEEQAFGRTSRQGHKGSGQLITFCSSLSLNGDTNSDQLLQERAHLEKKRLDNLKENDLPIIKTKDLLFSEFCQFYNQVRSALIQNRPKNNKLKAFIGNFVDPNEAYKLNPTEQVILQSLEELWAMFLMKVDDGRMDIAAAASWKFREFIKESKEKCQYIFDGLSNNTNSQGLICPPCESAFYYCQLGNLEYKSDSKTNRRMEVAGKYFDKAIEFDSNFAAPAHIGKAYILLKGSNTILGLGKIKYAKNFKENAIECLAKGLDLLSQEMTTLTSMQSLLYHRNRSISTLSECSDLYDQLLTKTNLLGSYTNSVEANLNGVIKSLRRVYCEEFSETGECIKEGFVSNGSMLTFTTPNDTLFYNLTFRDLTLHKDLIDSDQAVKTIQSSKLILTNQDDFLSRIYVECTSLESIAQLQIEPNLEFYKTSITQLKFEYSKLSLAEVDKILNQLVEYGFRDGYTLYQLTNELSPRMTSSSNIFEIFKQLQADSKAKLGEISSFKLILNGLSPARFINPDRDTDSETATKDWNEFISKFPLLKCTVKVSTHNFEELIKLFRSVNLDFAVNISKVHFQEAQEILASAAMDQEDIVLSQTKELTDLQMSGYTPLIEILELKSRGILLIVTFNERKCIPWSNVISVGLLAGAQMSLGTYLVWTGFGATIGKGLITEGAVDMITAIRITSTREFSWKQFAIQKSVSLTLSVATVGFQALKAVSSGAGVGSNVLRSVINEGAEQAGTQILVNSNNIFQTAKVGFQNFLKSSAGQALLITGEVGLRAGFNTAIEILSRFTFDQLRSQLSQSVEFYWLRNFKNKLYSSCRRHYALDKLFRSKTLNEKVQNLLRRMTTGKFSDFTETWMKTASVLCLAVEEFAKESSGYAIFFSSLVTYVSKLVDICTIIEKITEEMVKDLNSNADLRRSSAQFILLNACEVSHSQSISCANKIVFTKENNYDFEVVQFDEVGISNIVGPEKYENIRLRFKALHDFEKEFSMERIEILDLNSWVINEITNHLVGLADSNLFSPMYRRPVGSFISHFYPDLTTGEMLMNYLDKEDKIIGSEEGHNGNGNNVDLGARDGLVFDDTSEDIALNLNAGSVQAMSLDFDVDAVNASLANPSMLLEGRIM